MDTSRSDRDIVKQVIQRYAQFKPSHGEIRLDVVKVWIEYDGMERGINEDLMAAGIPAHRIVLAFLPDERTAAIA